MRVGLAAEAMRVAFQCLKTNLSAEEAALQKLGTVVLATVEGDIHDLGMAAMQAITGEWCSELRTGLSLFFGGECPLFWSLYSAIWPVFDRPMNDAIYEKFSSDCHDDLAELDAPWQFVSTGWCDQADE